MEEENVSAVCVALRGGANCRDIELMVKKGAPLNACLVHTSTLHCALVAFGRVSLKEDMVKILLTAGASTDTVNKNGHTPLQSALLVCYYEVNAIKLLFNASGGDANAQDATNNTLLHLAVKNPKCKVSVLQYLIDRGAKLDKMNNSRETPLHLALFQESRASIVNVLIRQGSVVNAKKGISESPLEYAFEYYRGPNSAIVLLRMLNAGVEENNLFSALFCALDWYDLTTDPKDLARLKMLLKYIILENGKLERKYLIDRFDCNTLLNVVNEYEEEVHEMGLKKIGYQYTLREFISQPFLPQLPPRDKNPALSNQNLIPLLKILLNNSFPFYFEMISAKIGRAWLNVYLHAVQVHTIKVKTFPIEIEAISILDYDTVYGIVEYLPLADILRLILACCPDDIGVKLSKLLGGLKIISFK